MKRLAVLLNGKTSLAIVVVLSIALGFSLAYNLNRPVISPAQAVSPEVKMEDFRTIFADVVQKAAPSVVSIKSEKLVDAPSMQGFGDLFGMPFGDEQPMPRGGGKQRQTGTGTGVIVRSDGYILTNDHVVGGADRVTVMLSDGREFKGVVTRDPRTDLALVKIEAKDLPAAGFTDSDEVKAGEWCIAMGGPFGLKNTVTVGVVSALRKQTDPDMPLPYPEVIQTDASINPGNSGGPLMNLDGKVMGINGAIISPTGSSAGIGFAIPANTAKFVMQRLISKGKVTRAYLGVYPRDITPLLSKQLGVNKGALIESVEKDGPADKAGLRVKDVITKIDGKQVGSAVELRHTVEVMEPNDTVKVTIVRDKKDKVIEVKLAELPSEEAENPQEQADKQLGLSVQPLTPEATKQLNIPEGTKGVLVRSVESGSEAERSGIRQGDVITEVNDTPVTSVNSFLKEIRKLKSGDTAVVVVQRGDRTTILELTKD